MNVSTNCAVMIPESHCKEFSRIEKQENRAMRNKIKSGPFHFQSTIRDCFS